MDRLPGGKYYLEVQVLDESDGVAVPPFGLALVRIGEVVILVNPKLLIPIKKEEDGS